jgi:hypothetical protein
VSKGIQDFRGRGGQFRTGRQPELSPAVDCLTHVHGELFYRCDDKWVATQTRNQVERIGPSSVNRRRTSVPRVCLSVTLATPASSGSADTSWLCRGRLPPVPAPPETGCPQLRSPAATGTTVQVFHLHSINKRLTAHRRIDAGARRAARGTGGRCIFADLEPGLRGIPFKPTR